MVVPAVAEPPAPGPEPGMPAADNRTVADRRAAGTAVGSQEAGKLVDTAARTLEAGTRPEGEALAPAASALRSTQKQRKLLRPRARQTSASASLYANTG